MDNRSEKTSVGKIITVTLAIVAGVCAVMWFAAKLYRKYCLLDSHDGEDEEGLDDELGEGDHECEIVFDHEEQEDAAPEDVAEDAKA